MLRKIGAIVVMILSAVGTLLCLVALVGAWVANDPTTEAVTDTLGTVDGYLALAAESAVQIQAELETVQTRVDSFASIAPDQVEVAQAAFVQEVTPILARVSNVASALSVGLNSVNETLTRLERLPGVDAPTFDAQVESLDANISVMASQLETISSTVSAQELDGERLVAAATAISQELANVQVKLQEWTTRISSARTANAAVTSATPGLLDLASWVVTLLFLLLGAGQVSLFLHALQWFRT